MNSDDRFIQQLESYLDDYEGATILPEHVRDQVRAALPRTKQTGAVSGPVRYLSMTLTKIGPVALAAAAGVLAIAVGIYLFGGRNLGDSDLSPSITPSPAASVSESAAPSGAAACSETTIRATGEGGTRQEIDWCSARSTGKNIPLSLTMEFPMEWVDLTWYGDVDSLWIRPEAGGVILFAVHPDQTVDELVDDIIGREGYDIVNPGTADVGDSEAAVFDVTLADGASSGATEPLFETPQQPFLLTAGSLARVWIVDHEGETFLIATGEALADRLGEALPTLTWEN
jgi:hypothetical protein